MPAGWAQGRVDAGGPGATARGRPRDGDSGRVGTLGQEPVPAEPGERQVRVLTGRRDAPVTAAHELWWQEGHAPWPVVSTRTEKLLGEAVPLPKDSVGSTGQVRGSCPVAWD